MSLVLLVDDRSDNLYLLEALLGGNGYEVVSASDGVEALALARQRPPALVVSDILMPGMDGFAFCRAWRQDPALKGIPFIFYTATYTDPRDEKLALDMGADRFLVKPAEPGVLMAVIRELLAVKREERHLPVEADAQTESVVMREYNQALVRKLEQKLVELEVALEARDVSLAAQRDAEAQRMVLESQLRQVQKLESIGTLASGVAHEINSPLHGILGYADLITERAREQGDSVTVGFAAEIVQEARSISALVQNLLGFARQDKQPHGPTSLRLIVDATLSLIRALLRREHIALEVDVPAGLPPVLCNSQQIQQVLMNLLTNARDALNEKYAADDARRKIRIQAGTWTSDDGPSAPQWVRLTVEDCGCGIPADVRERMFDPFFTTKPKDRGTGLGLSIIHGIITDHHGSIRVDSEPGQWTRFEVDLPCADGEGPSGAP